MNSIRERLERAIYLNYTQDQADFARALLSVLELCDAHEKYVLDKVSAKQIRAIIEQSLGAKR